MNKDVLAWLRWLVASQTVQIGAPDAQEQADMAWRAIAAIDAALAE